MPSVTSMTDNNTFVAGNKFWIIGKITFTGADSYVSGGITASLASPLIKSSRVPDFVAMVGSSGYVYNYVPGTNITNGKIKIFSGALAEISAGTVAAGIQNDVINLFAVFPGQL